MKKVVLILYISFIAIFSSCEKENVDKIFKEASFKLDEKILEGYFVTAINFDSKGTAWIGTFNQGLLRYYNGQVTIFNKDNSPLDSSFIYDIAIDKNDNVWIGTNGLIKYDGKTFKKYDSTNSIMPENFVRSLAIDKNNAIWFSSSRFKQGGLVKFDGNRWQLFTPENSKLPCNLIMDIVIDSDNTKWIAMGGSTVNEVSMVKITNNGWTLISDKQFGFDPYYWGDLAVNNDNSVIATLNYGLSSTWDITRPNIAICQGNTWKINNPSDSFGNSLGYVSTICCDSNGFIWAALESNPEFKKLAIFDGNKWCVNNDELETGGIFVMKADNKNRIWLGTGSGIQIIESMKK